MIAALPGTSTALLFQQQAGWGVAAASGRVSGTDSLSSAAGRRLAGGLAAPIPARAMKKRVRFPQAYGIVAELIRCLLALAVAYVLSVPLRQINALLAPVHFVPGEQSFRADEARIHAQVPTWFSLAHEGAAHEGTKDQASGLKR